MTPLSSRPRGAALGMVLVLVLLAGVAAAGWYAWQQWLAFNQLQAETAEGQAQALVALEKSVASERKSLDQAVNELGARVAENSDALRNLQAGGQRDWLLNEAAALASLAQQRLLLTADLDAAQRLLAAAAETLARISDPAVLPARRALAADQEALRGASQVDVQGSVLRLGALVELARDLTVPGIRPALADAATAPPDAESDWWVRLLAQMPVTVRRHDRPVPLPLDERAASLLRLSVMTALQQAQLALMQRQGDAYLQALAQVDAALQDWLPADDPRALQMRVAVDELKALPVGQALPEIGAGLKAITALQSGTAP